MSVSAFLDARSLEIKIPEQSEWVESGTVLFAGEKGEWDHYLYGGFAGSIIKKDSTYFLYYQGAADYSEKFGTVTNRAIGLATSHDGIHFTKYDQNPVITWSPNGGLEEGAVSAAATTDEKGDVVVFYGANTMINERLVSADGRLAVSADGVHFNDAGIVLDHTDRSLWGGGDEVFPLIGFQEGSAWYVFYVPNGSVQSGRLGVAWGTHFLRLTQSSPVREGRKRIKVWGMGGHARIGPSTFALFTNNVRQPGMEIRIVHTDNPTQLSAPVTRYEFDDFTQGTVLLDSETGRWLLYYRDSQSGAIRVKVAPVHPQE